MDGLQPITPAQARTIATWIRSGPEAVLFAGPEFSWPVSPQLLLGAPERRLSVYVLTDPAGRPVATGSLRPREDGRVAHIGRVLVDPGRRGEGWGRRLMEALLERAWADPGVELATLRVFVHNRPAGALYEKLGFRSSGQLLTTAVGDEVWQSVELRLPRPDGG